MSGHSNGGGRLAGKVAIVTGAGSGIGKACALKFGEEGAATTCADINVEAARATADEILARGGEAVALHLDVASESSAEACVAATVERFGPPDSIVNCAGIVRNGTAMNTDLETWNLIVGINLTGVWLMCKAALPHMVERKSGSIVNIASVGSLVASPSNAAYIAAKGGVATLTKSIAVDFAPYSIRANAICPGTVPTPLVINHYINRGEVDPHDVEASIAETRKRYPLHRHGRPEEIAALAVYLASDEESGFMTGSLIPIDGGISATAWQVGQ
jgi:NAD(P)-dependent dehydrogenase (short-subunit alcohol dehydrogenase family)